MTTTAHTTTQAPGAAETQDAGHVDVLIIGAGVSGIGVAHHLLDQFPDRTFVILDAQDNRGGTWWTHRYPGVRSDSDLFTYGYRFKPWRGPAIAAGGEILAYLDEVIDDDDLVIRIVQMFERRQAPIHRAIGIIGADHDRDARRARQRAV